MSTKAILDQFSNAKKTTPELAATCMNGAIGIMDKLEDEMAQHPQVQLEVDHWFADGLYARAMFIPEGVAAVGRRHKKGQLSVLVKGELTLIGEGPDTRIKAPKVMTSEAGIRRAAFAHSDSILVTVHATDCKDPDKVTELLTEPGRPHIEKVCKETGQGEKMKRLEE